MVEPGSWGKYVEEELPFSHSWANNYMRLYKELGGEQLSLFGNSQAIMNLQPTKAMELLVLPEQEREEFLENHDVEAMSSRELHQAIKDLADEKKARQAAEDQAAQLKEELDAVQKKQEAAVALEEQVKAAQRKEAEAAAELMKLKDQLRRAEAGEKNALEQLKQAKENPEIPDSVMEQMRKEAEAVAAGQAREEVQKQLAETEEKLKAARAAALEAEAKLEAAQKEVKLSNPNVVIFKTVMAQIQDNFNRMNGVLMKAQQEDPAVAENLKKAFLGMLDKLREAI